MRTGAKTDWRSPLDGAERGAQIGGFGFLVVQDRWLFHLLTHAIRIQWLAAVCRSRSYLRSSCSRYSFATSSMPRGAPLKSKRRSAPVSAASAVQACALVRTGLLSSAVLGSR